MTEKRSRRDDREAVMSPLEKRKNLRRAITYPALIDLGDGSPLRECSLCDASQEGAQLLVADPDSLPDQFVLALSLDGAARRNCRVVWRLEKQIGVTFLKDAKRPDRPSADAQAIAETGNASDVSKAAVDPLSQP